jgi:hypothetical protein
MGGLSVSLSFSLALSLSFLPPSQADAEKAVSQLCNKLPSPYNATCSTLVDTYFDMIWNLIDSYVVRKATVEVMNLQV